MSGTAASMILEMEARQQVLVVVPEVADNELILAPSASASLLASGEVNAFNCRRITLLRKVELPQPGSRSAHLLLTLQRR